MSEKKEESSSQKSFHFFIFQFIFKLCMPSDVLYEGTYCEWTFCMRGLNVSGRFVCCNILWVDILYEVTYCELTFCMKEHIVNGRFVWGNILWMDVLYDGTYCEWTFCMMEHILSGRLKLWNLLWGGVLKWVDKLGDTLLKVSVFIEITYLSYFERSIVQYS